MSSFLPPRPWWKIFVSIAEDHLHFRSASSDPRFNFLGTSSYSGTRRLHLPACRFGGRHIPFFPLVVCRYEGNYEPKALMRALCELIETKTRQRCNHCTVDWACVCVPTAMGRNNTSRKESKAKFWPAVYRNIKPFSHSELCSTFGTMEVVAEQ